MLMVVSSSWDYVCFSEPSIHNSVSSNLSPRTCIPFILTETRKRRQSGRKVHRKEKEEKERKKGRKERREGRRDGEKEGREEGKEGMKKKEDENKSYFLISFSYGLLRTTSTAPLASPSPAEDGCCGRYETLTIRAPGRFAMWHSFGLSRLSLKGSSFYLKTK